MHGSRNGRIAMAVLFAATAACSDNTTDPPTSFTATLNGASEKPTAVNTPATGTAMFAISGSSLTYSVTYSNLTVAPSASHIHTGTPSQSGGVQLNLCGAGAAPACPTTTSGTISGTADATYLATGATMDGVVTAMRSFGAYVNVHTPGPNAAGEIRGNIVGAY